jgi:hypothetical protein
MRTITLAFVCLMVLPGAAAASDVGVDDKLEPSVRLVRLAAAPSPVRETLTSDEVVLALRSVATCHGEGRRVARRGNWITRHPAAFGAIVGFTAGFLIGFLPGDDAVFDDFTAGFNGLVLGGVGAGAGAVVGWGIGRQ